ncbi:IS3-like element ISPpy1 family transposase [Psychrobacter sanguinis]|uniref:IS3-like element ISPpy1 family transposase n=1 Tax=Psychrobacter sanguinis TaxID=861445 RepID=UPI001D13F3A8|nr:IS3-like element ISPpy1 family transposase [Psychrobacter sanguinis]MCC3306843.1 IS3-like element ISPpy1 family transposase [Psychrobacter sanguinis]MCC3307936.1 IS3-like element ISPpy1 family transposase [Psychrobacter sanguinis]MCC3309392.1 IS3-like element ISPpy1 family transposase [Psychrobacter sanguinis]UEC24349.1 IS3-like element ISPpy1 family transposase [Psychrobacter sanguinis]UEC24702.1 IS3-like element ISPpy1 family transposase [Psychrobacter sanguinis]
MTKVRKRHNAEFKSKVAVEAIKEHKTLNELTAEYGVHATQISNWKKQALAVIPTAFNTKQQANEQAQQAIIDELHRQLGQVISERDWLKKKFLTATLSTRKQLLEPDNKDFSVRKQCELLSINRSSLYYQPKPISELDITLMNLLDQQYTKTPFYGVKRMTAYLRQLGYQVGEDRVRRLLRQMGLDAIYQHPNTSKPNSEHQVYPYLLRHVPISRCNQVWSTDITYIRLAKGFVYLMAVIDWYSRYVLDWSLSTTLEADFCVDTVSSLLHNGLRCEIFNTDQGSQFTSPRFTRPLIEQGIAISMDGRGRALDNIFVERLWRSVKYECVYLRQFETVSQARAGLKEYFEFYNHERLHQSLDYHTPAQVYLANNSSDNKSFYQPNSILIL